MRKHIPLSAALLAVPISLWAQSPTSVPDTTTTSLSEFVVEGRRVSDAVRSTAPMHKIDAEMMKKNGVTDIADALHRLPGVTLRDYGGAGGLKTISVRGFGASHTAVTYDGVPLSDVQSGQIDVSRYSLDNVSNLSLVVGDNSDIFTTARAAASAATFSISTESPFTLRTPRPQATLQMKIGSFGYLSPFFKVEAPVNKVTLQASGEYVHAKNDYPFTLTNQTIKTKEHRSNSMMNSGHVELNALWRIAPRHSFAAKAYYYDNWRELPGPVVYYNPVSNESLRERSFFSQVRYRGALSSKLSLMAIAKFTWSASLYHDENGKYPGGVLNQNYWQREAYVSGSLLYTPAPGWSFNYAADYFFNNLNSNLPADQRPRRHSLLQSFTGKWSGGPFTVMARALWSVYLNSTLSGQSAKDANRISPSASLAWRPIEGQDFYVRLSYKNIFRMPTFNEAYFDHYGSADLKPETTDQLNLGLTYSFDVGSWLPDAVFTVDSYMNHVKDMIVAVPFNMFVWSMVNLSKVRVFGIDVTANVRFQPAALHALTLMGSYSFQRAEPRTDPSASDWMKQVAYIPRNSGSLSLGWENPWANFNVSATGVSDRFTTNNNIPQTRIKGYVECGAGLWRIFNVKKSKIEVRANVLNIFNKQYEVVANYPMPGRSWQLSVRYTI